MTRERLVPRERALWGALIALSVATIANGVFLLGLWKGQALAPGREGEASAPAAVDSSVEAGLGADGSGMPQVVSLTRVMANPGLYNGKRLVLVGYIGYRAVAGGSYFLYSNAEDAEYDMIANGISLDVRVIGSFEMRGPCSINGVFRAAPGSSPVVGELKVERVLLMKLVPGADGGAAELRLGVPNIEVSP